MRRCRVFHHGTKSCGALRSGISLSAVPMLNGWWLAANAFILIVFGTNLRVIRRKSTKQPESITLRFMRDRVPCNSAFAQFLSIPKDAEDNKVSMTTKLTMPVLAIGAAKAFGANVAIIMRNAADNVTEVLIANSGHWLMDEQPSATIAAVRNFLDQKTNTQSIKPGK